MAPRGILLRPADLAALGVRSVEIGVRFTSDALERIGGTYEIVHVSRDGVVVQRVARR
jgi:hypothetical protein